MNIQNLIMKSPLMRHSNIVLKRIFDMFFSAVVLLTVFPIAFLIIGTSIKILMPGPIFFSQKRTGKNGCVFRCYKFRSMDAHNKEDEFVDPKKNKFFFGNIIRATSLDEIPQFWNVFCGDMSIIGPRPHMLVHDEEYRKVIENYDCRYSVRPGITGWAQVNGLRGDHEIELVRKRVEYDIWYIEHWNVWLDLKIMLRTVGVMIHKEA